MKKILYYFLCYLIIVLGILGLVGKENFFLGSLLGALQFPLILIGGLILFVRRKKGFAISHFALAGVVGMLLLHALYDRSFRIRYVPNAPTKKEVSLLTCNVFFKNNHKQNILNEIKANDSDLLFVQELTPTWRRTLAPLLNSRYKYKKTFVSRYTYGMGIYSKYPILSCTYIKNSNRQPYCQVSEVKINGEKVVFVNVHTASPAIAVENPDNFFSLYQANYKDRKYQFEEIENYLKNKHKDQPMIMVGDLNTMRIEPIYRKLRHSWGDLQKRKGFGPGWTFPNVASTPFPMITLDYILYRGDILGVDAKVLPGSSSDHLAVWGKVKL